MLNAYSYPVIYDIAFGDRNVAGEVDFLLHAGEKYLARKVETAIELACGPAYHCREIARRGTISEGVDLSAEMVEYANSLIVQERLTSIIHQGDMRRWRAPRAYDLAYCLLVSFAHLLTNDDILAHFNCVANLLSDGGIYIISHAHPRDFYGTAEPSGDRIWTNERDGIVVETDWGGENQTFDPIAEIDELTISYTVTADGNMEQFESREKLRRLAFQTLMALLKMSGRFEVVAMLGDFDLSVPLESEEAVRLVAVLKRV